MDLRFFIRRFNCLTCGPTLRLAELIREAASLSGKEGLIRVRVYEVGETAGKYGVERVPAITLLNGRISYVGVPSGAELNQFIETLISVSSGRDGLPDEVKEGIRRLGKKRVKIQVLVTPTCPYCPYVAYGANMMALASHEVGGGITSETVELYENRDIAEKHMVFSVPAIVVNGELRHIGTATEYDLLNLVLEGST